MKVLVTGAAGFIGSHVLRQLLAMGVEARGIDNFSNFYSIEYKRERLRNLLPGISQRIYNCDISTFQDLDELVEEFRPDFFVHLAAQAGVRLSLDHSQTYITSNILGFHNVVRSAIRNNVKGVLYASSSSVYGDFNQTPYKETSLNLRPKSIYGVTKLSNELFAEIQSRTNPLRMRGLRYFTVYGPWGRPDMAYFRLAAAALVDSPFRLFGDGSIKRDFTYIDDVVQNTIRLLLDLERRSDNFHDIVNVGGSRPLDMNYLVRLIQSHSEYPAHIIREQENALDSKITMADNEYMRTILGDLHFTSLEEGVAQLMQWAMEPTVRTQLANWVKSSS